ncbi:GntR family transcriptional regulator [Streptomyces olivoverticillatus]|uniref:GntR family transcriptional regulator n=1 Tax=Streptomyces olivoverticillatus TaxID=66427 RepID=A0A7W7LLV3_9ACTN|nr:GntR family transcriptional regulator [Streptomyces olivoverticillatus]
MSETAWNSGRSIWSDEAQERTLAVDRIEVAERVVPEHVAGLLGVEPIAKVWARKRRYVLDGRPVLLSTSYLPADLVAGSAITREDTGPGGIYARLAELGCKPVRFREEIRCRMPSAEESRQLDLSAGTPVVLIRRTAFAEGGRAVEVSEMTLDSTSYVLEYEFDA